MRTECEEIAEGLPIMPEMRGRCITQDEARRIVIKLNPSWQHGAESFQVIENTAMAYAIRHNTSLRDKRKV